MTTTAAVSPAAPPAGPDVSAALRGALERHEDPGEALLRTGYDAVSTLAALSEHYGVPAVEYDERLSVDPDVVSHIDHTMLTDRRWFPMAIEPDGAVLVAACAPDDPDIRAEVERHFPGRDVHWTVALRRDLHWFVEDFLRRADGGQIGAQRTNLAYWRNTMATWRTKMACYRTDMAQARTNLNVMRWGLGLVALSNHLLRAQRTGLHSPLFLGLVAVGLIIAALCFRSYLRVRWPSTAPPRVQTLVEVTAASLQFLEGYHFLDDDAPDDGGPGAPSKPTMLGRLGELLACHSTILDPSASYRLRITLARERNVLAAQRTVCACYRTIASRARTGLALLRTGVAIFCLGLGLLTYYGLSMLSAFDVVLVVAGLYMMVDGGIWYWPVRAESANTPRCLDCEVS